MDNLFAFLSFISIVLLIVGLIKPAIVIRWGENKTRLKVVGVYAGMFFLFAIIGSSLAPAPPIPFTVKSSIPNEEITTENKVIFSGEVNKKKFELKINGKLIEVKNSKYQKTYNLKTGLNKFNIVFKSDNKKEELKQYSIKHITKKQLALKKKKEAEENERLRKIEEKAKTIAKRNKKLKLQFSEWDGSHKALERYIIQIMNDPDSYEHVKTVYWDKISYLIVSTTFRGKNAFGGKVLNAIKAKITLDGQILKIIN